MLQISESRPKNLNKNVDINYRPFEFWVKNDLIIGVGNPIVVFPTPH